MGKSEKEGRNLKSLLSEAKMTQRELAERMKVSYSLVGFYIRGEKTPGFDKAILMAKILKVSLKTLGEYMGYNVEEIPNDQ